MTRVPVCPNPNCESISFTDAEYQLSSGKVIMVICTTCGWVLGVISKEE